MAIDINTETPIALQHVPDRLPCRRARKPVHVATVYRWTVKGVRGVVLESFQCGGTRCTTLEALQRFFDRLSSDQATKPQESRALSAAHRRDVQRAEAVLDAAGA